MGNNITSDLNKVGIRKERPSQAGTYISVASIPDTRRVGWGGTQATSVAIADGNVIAMDKPDGEMDIPESMRNREELNVIGEGRNTAGIVELGYEPVEQTFTVNAQTGIFIYHALGKVVTTGTALDPAVTSAGATGQDSNTMAGFVGLTPDAHIGRIVVVTNGTFQNYVFTITDNDATTLTLNTQLPTGFDASAPGPAAPTAQIYGSPYTHTISEPSATATQSTNGSIVYLPSFIMHYEQSDGTQTIYRDLIGCLVKSLKISIEKGAKIMFEVTVLCPKSMVGIVQTSYPAYALSGDASRAVLSYNTDEIFVWDDLDVSNSYFRYDQDNNGVLDADEEVFGSIQKWFNEMTKLEITIENDITYEYIGGDEFAYKVLVGKRDYSIVMSYYPNSDEIDEGVDATYTGYRLLWALGKMKLSEYAGELGMKIQVSRSATDYFQLTFNSLYVSEYPNKLSTINEKVVAVDVTLRNAPVLSNLVQGVCAAVVVDDRNTVYYEDT